MPCGMLVHARTCPVAKVARHTHLGGNEMATKSLRSKRDSKKKSGGHAKPGHKKVGGHRAVRGH